jgi:nicotinamide phosphoribosyltransferase
MNIILNTDSYKASHYLQYPKHSEFISSYIEPRGGDYQQVLFFGLQMFLKEYLLTAVSQENINEAEDFFEKHGLPFNKSGWQYIVDKYRGKLPLAIEAVTEGTVLPIHNVLVQVINTDPICAWLVGYLETAMLRAVWYPTTVATISWHCKQIIKRYLEKTADHLDGLIFKLHDFGARGASSLETAGLGAAAHLVNFTGTDTIAGIIACRDYYHEPMAGFSIPAAEHSTITSWGKAHEVDAYKNMLTQFGGANNSVAVVSDSYDLWYAIDELWGEQLKDQVINNGGTLVIRPDSGNPVEVVVEAVERLMHKFGFNINSKGYKVLPPYLRVIQGDGISSPKVIDNILNAMMQQDISADNVAFGMGGGLLQKLDRDTLSFAMKTSAIKVSGQWHDVYKAPKTDMSKQSKRGRLALINTRQGIKTIQYDQLNGQQNLLQPTYKNGELLVDLSLSAIRKLAEVA